MEKIGDEQIGDLVGRPANEKIADAQAGGYFVGLPGNEKIGDYFVGRPVNEEQAGDYFVGRPANHEQQAPPPPARPSILGKIVGLSGGSRELPESSTKYEYSDLVKATKKFTSRIRLGEFGVVNMAVLDNGKVLAVQTLRREKKGEKTYKNFAHAISTLDHKNLLKLDGYCMDKLGAFLCYEHQQPYQTLEDCLLAGTYNTQLNWQQRVSILKGICEGLQYLEGCKTVIKIRVTLKVDCILLHEDKTTSVLTPKLAEFGISKKLDEDATPGGYGPTDDFVRKRKDDFSPDIDIKSFGIILMVMVSGLSKTSNKLDPFGKELIAVVNNHHKKNDLVSLRDPFLSKADCQEEIEECIELALNCTSEYEAFRPRLAQIAPILANLGRKKQEKAFGGYTQRRYHNLHQELGQDETSSKGSGHVKVDHVQEYGYDELSNATENFADHCEIGRGAFGIVYKAVLNDKVIAVKKLQKERFSGQFLNEVSILIALRHKNLVKLEGYCFNRHGTMLCYEHLPGGTLQDRLQGQGGNLDWKQRYHIIQGICKGLQYLHDECPDGVRIVHMDLKTDNVLVHVDANGVLTPKIGDFGISWPLDLNKEHQYVDMPVGNINCTPPEYHVDGKISTGVDIYSFGLLMLDMLIGQPRAQTDKKSHYGRHIVNQVQNHLILNDLHKLIDQSLGTAYQQEIHECIELALNCAESDENKRPNIGQISLKLAQIGEGKVRKPLLRSNASIQAADQNEESSKDELENKVIKYNNTLAASKESTSLEDQQHDVSLTWSGKRGRQDGALEEAFHPNQGSSHKPKMEAINSGSTATCNYLYIDAAPANAGDHTSVESIQSDLLDFTLDFDAIYEEEPSCEELDSTTVSTKQEKETKKALKQIYEALRDVLPHQIAEFSGFIKEMVNGVLANGGEYTPSDELQAGLMELVALSKDEDAMKRAKDRAARRTEINKMKSQCAKFKATMQEHAVEAKKLAMQQTQLKKRKEALQSELEKIESRLKDLPASIAQEKSIGMAAQAEGITLAEQVLNEEAEIGDTSADEALLARVQRVQKGVCAQLEGILQKS
ncbi:hypothetical protein CFC21_008503 [Triticum aestivum]|uniref:Protein kinase domain-containing protein n=2 Tax=Triticum aestivum TaxID=4565 RepID=A0A9R1DGF3_WHEAT|nr:serine/threonine-protein kinase 10-like isoform X2 [Triticum aestivum]KAF6991417.1 hypothetical protein CFC21_008503 [Triticum aestivum]